jgi:hypothetical protein
MTTTAKRSESGIVVATTIPARRSPSKRRRTPTTRMAPSTRFLPTVPMARSTSAERS